MMRYLLLSLSASTMFTVTTCSFLLDDPGEALYLTKYIESGDIKTARSFSMVPKNDIPIESYAGYFTVDKQHNSNLFFWYFPAANIPDEAPVLLVLQGGPGCSSLVSAFLENGPYSVNPDGKLIPREFSWHTNHNVVYIDSPVGTGFSFTDSPSGYANSSNDVARDLLSALQQFFLLFPKLQKNKFFVTGESYGGKFVLALGHAIHHNNKCQIDEFNDLAMPKINLKGLIIGSGLLDPLHQFIYSEHLYHLGLIDSNTRQVFAENEKRQVDCILNNDYKCAHKIFQNLIHSNPGSLFSKSTGFEMYFNYAKPKKINFAPLKEFVQNAQTRRAIHVGNNVFSNVGIVNVPKIKLWLDVMVSYAEYLAELSSHYPVLIYNGQFDIISASPMMENFLNHLNFTGADQYRSSPRHIWRVHNEIAGYMKSGGNLTSVLVRNAGHLTAADQPEWILKLILKFTYHLAPFAVLQK